ncbi:hypothetical protein [Clostridium isatidis]|uniref:hypothetical protein n=1 Tax=Clostridium isatidis TaxID=182773 RepID=UPI0017A094BA|nr:hypothetical protein [Clostridiales bacterium]
MFNNKYFCEKCKKIQPIYSKKINEVVELNLGEMEYEKEIGFCCVCGEEIYSVEIAEKNKRTFNRKLKEFEESYNLARLIEAAADGNLEIIDGKEAVFKKIQDILSRKNQK